MIDYAIRTEHLSCHFGDIRAVDDLSLEVPKGIVFGFLGPNGSGKTTTVSVCCLVCSNRDREKPKY